MNDPGIEGLIQCELETVSLLIEEERKTNELIDKIIYELRRANKKILSFEQELNDTRVVFAAILKHEHSKCLD